MNKNEVVISEKEDNMRRTENELDSRQVRSVIEKYSRAFALGV